MDTTLFKSFRDKYVLEKKRELDILSALQLPVFKSISFDCSKLSNAEEYCKEILDKMDIEKDSKVIYYFTLESKSYAKEIIDLVGKLKGKTKKVKLPMVNSKNEDSQVLYVGKTNSNFPYRLLTHLTIRSASTFALHLEHWAMKKGYKMKLYYTEIELGENPIHFLEMTESILHDYLKPILGRSGH